MRVALLTNFIAPYRVTLLEALRDRVGELRVFLSTRMESDRSWAAEWGSLEVVVQRNITVRRWIADSAGFRRQLQMHFPYDTLAQLARYRPEVVVSGELGARSLQAMLYKVLCPSTRFLVWATLSDHTEREWGAGRRWLRRRILERADAVLVNGESGARYIRRFGIPDERIFRVNQPVDVAMFSNPQPVPPSGRATRLLYVGQLVSRKGLIGFMQHLIGWARAHPDRMLEIWWIGEGELQAKLKTLELPPNLSSRMVGPLRYADLPPYYAQCDVFVFPSLSDEWGLVVNEAMAASLPVLGSIYSQAVEELVKEGETGWRFDPLDSRSVMASFDKALSVPPEELRTMGAQAREKIAHLTPQSAAERVAAAIVGSSRDARLALAA